MTSICGGYWYRSTSKTNERNSARTKGPSTSVSNGSGLPGCGPGLEADRMIQSWLLHGLQGYPPGSVRGSNRTAVPFYHSYNFGSN